MGEKEADIEKREGYHTVMGTHVWSLLQTLQLLASSVLFCFHIAFNLALWTTNRC